VQDIKIFYPSFEFRDRTLGILRAWSGKQFELDTEAVFKGFFELFAQYRGRRAAGDDFTFLLCRFDDAFPIVLDIGAMRRNGEKQSAA
jgi:hypothetical protein